MIPPRISTLQTSDLVSSFPFDATENFHFLSRNGAIVHLLSGGNPSQMAVAAICFLNFEFHFC